VFDVPSADIDNRIQNKDDNVIHISFGKGPTKH